MWCPQHLQPAKVGNSFGKDYKNLYSSKLEVQHSTEFLILFGPQAFLAQEFFVSADLEVFNAQKNNLQS